MLQRVHSYLFDEQGVTLVELLLVLSLLGMVLGIAYSIHFFGTISFSRGSQQAAMQQEARFLAKVLSDEIRFAHNIKLLNAVPEEVESNYAIIFMDETGKIVKKDRDSRTHLGPTSENISAILDFKLDTSGHVEFGVEVISKTGKYKLETSVLALNLEAPLDSAGVVMQYRVLGNGQ